ncbi:MAG TPA: hypothetical protein VKU60_03790, partial [Chloroflexota bacterium]|nr:hypothetical protein [Chloroflexota bacterium]
MPVTLAISVFAIGAVVSLSMSWLLVSRLERVGEWLGFSEALLGVVAALAADAPEITSAVTALINREAQAGAGVVIGANVFNVAASLGLSAVIAGRILLHRKVVILAGATAVWAAAVCLATVLGVISPPAGLAISLVVVAFEVFVMGSEGRGLVRLP